MRLHCNDDVEQHKAVDGEAMGIKQPGNESSAKANYEQFPWMQILSDPTERAVIFMVYGVDPSV